MGIDCVCVYKKYRYKLSQGDAPFLNTKLSKAMHFKSHRFYEAKRCIKFVQRCEAMYSSYEEYNVFCITCDVSIVSNK